MTGHEIDDPAVRALFVQLASVRLLLHVIAKAMLPEDKTEAREEIAALIKQVESLGMRGVVGSLDEDSSRRLMKVAVDDASAFLKRLLPEAQGH